MPQFAAARDAAIDADGVTISQQLVPSGIVLVISEGIFALEESWSEAPALALWRRAPAWAVDSTPGEAHPS